MLVKETCLPKDNSCVVGNKIIWNRNSGNNLQNLGTNQITQTNISKLYKEKIATKLAKKELKALNYSIETFI